MTTWRKQIKIEMAKHGEDFGDVLGCTLDDAGLDTEFDEESGGAEGEAFTLWTGKRVYFPATYDGAEWAASVPRNPCGEATDHVGG
jgi:hypothetical protein